VLSLQLEGTLRAEGIFVLAAIATVGVAAGDSSLTQVSANDLNRLAIKVTETFDTVACANRQSTEELVELIPHLSAISKRVIAVSCTDECWSSACGV
jgi:hypothetical protein